MLGRPKLRDKAAQIIKEALGRGTRSVEELCRLTGLRASTLSKVFTEEEIELPEDVIPYRFRPEIDTLIDEGLNLREIKNRIGISSQGILYYIIGSGQHNNWLKNRKLYEKNKRYERLKKESLEISKKQFLYDTIRYYLLEEANKAGPEYEKAVEYRTNKRRIKKGMHSWDILIKVFRNYYNALGKKVKVSLEDLAEGQLHPSSVSDILKGVGLDPMYGSRERKVTPQYKKEALERALNISISTEDIAYFLGIKDHVVACYFKHHNNGRTRNISKLVSGKRITYSLASQIYEFEDYGFERNYIAESLDVGEKNYGTVIKNRRSIEAKIINALKVLYPDRSITKPYTKIY
ncbi:hypothetical protein J4230_01015 [Candidatus Woesearchaeota archaeon]|nr:hypothetical protein [Candidatus Woesearchaeota archaeon]